MNGAELVDLAKVRTLVRNGDARSIRLGRGLSVGEVAGAVGVAKATVMRWEARQRVPRGAAALRYGELLEALRPGGDNGA